MHCNSRTAACVLVMSSVLVAAGAARGSDSTRKYGSSDGEIFTIVRNGVKQTSMRGYAGRMTIQELWSLVNYLRSLGPSTNTSQ